MIERGELLNKLLENFINNNENIVGALIYDRDGLLIASKFKREKRSTEEEVIGALTGIIESVLSRIGKEYNMGKYATGSFEIENNRLIFTESGPKSILVCITNFFVTLNYILPHAFLVAEKIAKILDDKIDDGFSINVPNLYRSLDNKSVLKNLKGRMLDLKWNDKVSVKFNVANPIEKTMRYKLIVLGDAAVGKTSIINKFASNKFIEDYLPTLGISITEQTYYVKSNASVVEFMIWDLAGQKFFERARKAYMTGAHAAFIVFDVTSRESFDNVTKWNDEINHELKNVIKILIGNKIDLVDQRVVTRIEAEELSAKLNSPYIETSAKTGENIKELFQLLGVGLFFLKSL